MFNHTTAAVNLGESFSSSGVKRDRVQSHLRDSSALWASLAALSARLISSSVSFLDLDFCAASWELSFPFPAAECFAARSY